MGGCERIEKVEGQGRGTKVGGGEGESSLLLGTEESKMESACGGVFLCLQRCVKKRGEGKGKSFVGWLLFFFL